MEVKETKTTYVLLCTSYVNDVIILNLAVKVVRVPVPSRLVASILLFESAVTVQAIILWQYKRNLMKCDRQLGIFSQ